MFLIVGQYPIQLLHSVWFCQAQLHIIKIIIILIIPILKGRLYPKYKNQYMIIKIPHKLKQNYLKTYTPQDHNWIWDATVLEFRCVFLKQWKPPKQGVKVSERLKFQRSNYVCQYFKLVIQRKLKDFYKKIY